MNITSFRNICTTRGPGTLDSNSIGSGYFAFGGKIAPCYFAIWRQNSPNGYFAASAKIALRLILTQILTLTQTLTLILALIPTLTLTQTLT